MNNRLKEQREQASRWMEENKHLINIPGELSTCRVVGQLHHPISGDGHTMPWWQHEGEVAWSRARDKDERPETDEQGEPVYKWKVKSERAQTIRFEKGRRIRTVGAAANRAAKKSHSSRNAVYVRCYCNPDTRLPEVVVSRLGNRSDLQQPAFNYGLPEEISVEEKKLSCGARRGAEKQMETHGHLLPATVVMGQPVPRGMWLDSQRGCYQARRAKGVILHLADVYTHPEYTPEEMVADNRMVELIALADLTRLLRSYCTEKEIEALEQRATGSAVKDRHCLKRAQRKAQAGLGESSYAG